MRDLWAALTAFRGTLGRPATVALGVLGFVLVLLLWIGIVEARLIGPKFLPPPLDILRAAYSLFTEFEFADDILASLYRVGLAFLAAALMAIPIGILMSSYRVVGALNEPLIDFIRYLPVPALVPLTVIWFGIGESSKIMLLWMGTFFQLVLLIADGAKRVPHEYVEIAYTLGAKPRQVLRKIILPAMLPGMVDNLRITLGWCWSYVIVAEIVAANEGIGFLIMSSRRYGKMPEVMVGILAIGIIGLVSDQLIRHLHRRAFRYLA